MPAPTTEEVRKAILEDLQAGLSYRQIQAKRKVGAGTVSSVAQKAGLAPKRSRKTQPSAPGAPAAAPGGVDGLREYIPKPVEKRSERKPTGGEQRKQDCPHCPAQWTLESGEQLLSICPACKGHLDAQRAAVDEVYQCGACDGQWTLDKDEAQVKACPYCGVALHV